MSKKHLKLEPIQVKDDEKGKWWYYEDADGIDIRFESPTRKHFNTKISWRKLRASLRRKDHK